MTGGKGSAGHRVAAIGLCAVAICLFLPLVPAAAAPPASCASKFVGTWSVTVLATGQNYRARILANGIAIAECPLCAALPWTCSGNTYMIPGHPNATHTLSPDGRRMAGGCCSSVRIGGSAVASGSGAKEGPAKAAATPSKEWQTCANGSAEPGIAACTTLIRTRISGSKKLNPDDVGWAFGTRAFHFANESEHARALSDVEESIRLRAPKNLTFSYYVRGLVYQNQSDHTRAITEFSKAVELNPKAGVAFAARGKSYLVMGDIGRGSADYESAGQASPEFRARYAMERELLADWLQYLREIQDAGDFPNWSAPPLDALRLSGR